MSNRLLQADFQDYLGVLKKYISFLENTPIIIEYIRDCGQYELDVEQEVKEVQQGSGNYIFSIGDTEQEEVRDIFAILKCIAKNNLEVQYGIAWGYSSNKYQDKIKGFNQRFVMILIRHVENFLTNVGIDMGLDDKVSYNVSVQNGQAIFAGDNATITATNTVGVDKNELEKLISAVMNNTVGLTDDEIETVKECMDTVAAEAQSQNPKKSALKIVQKTLSAIKGSAEFAAAVAALIQFIGPLL